MKWTERHRSLTPAVAPSCLSDGRATIAAPRRRNVSGPSGHPSSVAPVCTAQHVCAYVKGGQCMHYVGVLGMRQKK